LDYPLAAVVVVWYWSRRWDFFMFPVWIWDVTGMKNEGFEVNEQMWWT
jgi:hypothetical protein